MAVSLNVIKLLDATLAFKKIIGEKSTFRLLKIKPSASDSIRLCIQPELANFPFEAFSMFKNLAVVRIASPFHQPSLYQTGDCKRQSHLSLRSGTLMVGEEPELSETYNLISKLVKSKPSLQVQRCHRDQAAQISTAV
jgi:hypothetical protein